MRGVAARKAVTLVLVVVVVVVVLVVVVVVLVVVVVVVVVVVKEVEWGLVLDSSVCGQGANVRQSAHDSTPSGVKNCADYLDRVRQ